MVIKLIAYEITYQMLRHDTRPTSDYYRGYLAFTKNDMPLTDQDFADLNITNSMGLPVPITLVNGGNIETYTSIRGNCIDSSCTWAPPSTETGISFNINTLALDDYTVTIDMVDEQISTVIPYSEDITVPVINDASMNATWQSDDLVLSWVNPISEPNWSRVDTIRITLYDKSGFSGLLEVAPANESIVVPSAFIQDIKNHGSGTLYGWRIQTLTHTNDPSNHQNARGWSNFVYLIPTVYFASYQATEDWNYLVWTPVNGATGYRVYWGTESGVDKNSNMLSLTTTTDYGHSGIVGGATYYYRVSAIDTQGYESELSDEVSVSVPESPSNVSAIHIDSSDLNSITWNPVSGALQYRVYWGTEPGVNQNSNMLSPTTVTAYYHNGVMGGYTYYYRISAVSSTWVESALSNEVSVFVPFENSTVTPPTITSAYYQSSLFRNYVSWNSVSGANQYRVYWGTEPGVDKNSNMLSPTTATAYGHTGVIGGYTYYYRVSAVSSTGVESDLSNEVNISIPLVPPNGVSVVYQANNGWNYLTWDSVSGALQYRVYWGTEPGVDNNSEMLTPTTTTDYGHSGVLIGNTYYYRVSVVNPLGIESNLSQEVSVTVGIFPM